jgi:hypothetical protein
MTDLHVRFVKIAKLFGDCVISLIIHDHSQENDAAFAPLLRYGGALPPRPGIFVSKMMAGRFSLGNRAFSAVRFHHVTGGDADDRAR